MHSYDHLDPSVLRKVMGGMLLTHYRSRHPRGESDLQVAEGVELEDGGYVVTVDIAIIERRTRRIVALYQLLSPERPIADVQVALERLQAYRDSRTKDGYPVELGVVVPESRETEITRLPSRASRDLQLVTYAA